MWLLVLAYLGGVLTIVSPCILAVLPFVFARTGQPFVKSGLPIQQRREGGVVHVTLSLTETAA